MLMKASVEILFEASSEAEASDLISETMRGLLTEFDVEAPFVDWKYSECASPVVYSDGKGFEYCPTTPIEGEAP